MKNINNLKPKTAIILEGESNEVMTLILNETVVEVTTDGTEHVKKQEGLITFINEDGLKLEAGDLIFWEYVKEINVL
ncbi:hypothetical protein G9F71_008555 [Clostridium sp. FP2]|uniref:hypothetical protein n=1 Tax=Clostridium sp. FP2 TaxID=2724481 RepID=UPI0013E95AEC|nr:hypothetical protein [Clostridium sp. FP2]MBZ9622903.1 hypothetical protein [Clostridium sp. FP2]